MPGTMRRISAIISVCSIILMPAAKKVASRATLYQQLLAFTPKKKKKKDFLCSIQALFELGLQSSGPKKACALDLATAPSINGNMAPCFAPSKTSIGQKMSDKAIQSIERGSRAKNRLDIAMERPYQGQLEKIEIAGQRMSTGRCVFQVQARADGQPSDLAKPSAAAHHQNHACSSSQSLSWCALAGARLWRLPTARESLLERH